jgi:dipeptidyl aminopeptidase/acylaminoacyl peptidase
MAFKHRQFVSVCLFLISLNASISIVRAQAPKKSPSPDYRPTIEIQQEDFATARSHFKSQILRSGPSPSEWEDLVTPKGAVEVLYPSGNLKLKAWMSHPSATGKHQAVLFLHPGFDLGPDDWDLTAPLREAGYFVMLPTTRGENGQHGVFTMFYDEVSDVVSAADYLRSQPDVDAQHVYVAGYSVGGTLTMLAAELYGHFRAAASISGTPDLGPYLKYARGAKENAPFDFTNPKEIRIRSALAYAASLKCPIRIYYGTEEEYFAIAAPRMAEVARQKGLDAQAVAIKGDHGSSSEQALRQTIEFFKKEQ